MPVAVLVLSGLSAAAASLYIVEREQPYSATFMYFVVLCVFHLGAVVPLSLGFDPPRDVEFSLSRWFYQKNTEVAVEIVLLGLSGFCVGALGCSALTARAQSQTEGHQVTARAEKILAKLSFLIFLAGFALWVILILWQFGISPAEFTYDGYQRIVEKYPVISWAYLLMGVGIVLVAATENAAIRRHALRIFFVWSVPAFVLGLRGEVLFPSVVLLVMYARRGFRPRGITLMAPVIVLLVLISVVRETRNAGLLNSSFSEIGGGPLGAVVELGSSIRPVVEVVGWRELGEQSLNGATYWAPLERAISRFIPLISVPPADQDMRLMNIVIDQRAGPIGFSPIAEALVDFGVTGVFFVMLVTGAVLAFLDRLPRNLWGNAMLAVILFPLVMQVRNAFTPVPAQIAFGGAVVGFSYLLARIRWRQ